MRFLFWNTHNNSQVNQTLCDIIWNNKIDIVSLAEYNGNVDDLINCLKANDIYMSKYISVGCEKVITLGNIRSVQPGLQDKRYSIQIINGKYILCSLHLPSQLYGSEEDRAIVAQKIVHDIDLQEKELGSNASIIFGDFNEDPYDSGCLSARHFHGLPSRDDAARGKRTVQGNSFSMFYNPMWNLFGDFTSPPGTYYHENSQALTPFWHMYDQVMIRPSLQHVFVENSLKILTNAGIDSLLDANGRPNIKFSDHLPIIFELREE